MFRNRDAVAARTSDGPLTGEFGDRTAQLLRLGALLSAAMCLALILYLGAIAVSLNLADHRGVSIRNDFAVFWAAAKLALDGSAIAAFDWRSILAAQSLTYHNGEYIYYWLYPPSLHIVISPLGAMGFTPAFALFTLAGLLLYSRSLAIWCRDCAAARTLAFASPAVAAAVFFGNLALIWVAVLLLALRDLRDGHDLRSGILIALLTVKPQLGVLIPVALLAGGHWRAFRSATVTVTAIVGVTIAVFGIGYWVEFATAVGQMSDIIAHAKTSPDLAHMSRITRTMITWYAFAREIGVGSHVALTLQLAVLLAAASSVWTVWSGPARFESKAAVLCLATLLCTPYAFQYELVLAVAAAFLLSIAGAWQWREGRLVVAALWLLPVPNILHHSLFGTDIIAGYAAPALTLALAAAVVMARRPAPA